MACTRITPTEPTEELSAEGGLAAEPTAFIMDGDTTEQRILVW